MRASGRYPAREALDEDTTERGDRRACSPRWAGRGGGTRIQAIGDQDFLLDQNHRLHQALDARGITNVLDIWAGYPHDWPAWRLMIQKHCGW